MYQSSGLTYAQRTDAWVKVYGEIRCKLGSKFKFSFIKCLLQKVVIMNTTIVQVLLASRNTGTYFDLNVLLGVYFKHYNSQGKLLLCASKQRSKRMTRSSDHT
jgi:hypothetical protein